MYIIIGVYTAYLHTYSYIYSIHKQKTCAFWQLLIHKRCRQASEKKRLRKFLTASLVHLIGKLTYAGVSRGQHDTKYVDPHLRLQRE